MSSTPQTSSNTLFLAGEYIQVGSASSAGSQNGTDGAVHIAAPANTEIFFESTVQCNEGLGVDRITDRADNTLLTVPVGTTKRIEFDAGATVASTLAQSRGSPV